MRIILLLYFLSTHCILYAQEDISLLLKSKTEYKDSMQIAKSYDNSNFYLIKNSIVNKNSETTYTYNNIDLGELYKIDLFNPLQIKLFYKDLNSMVILDIIARRFFVDALYLGVVNKTPFNIKKDRLYLIRMKKLNLY